MPESSDSGGSSGDGKSSGGQQGAGTPEQLATLKTELLQEVNRTLDGALSSRIGRLEGKLSERLDSLAEKFKPAGKNGSEDTGKPADKNDTQSEVETLRQELAAERKLRSTERRHAAIRSALNAHDDAGRAICRDTELAFSLMKDDENVTTTDAGDWVGKVKGELGDAVQAPLSQVVAALLTKHKVLSPATATGGAGAQGSGGGGAQGAPAGQAGMPTADEYEAMSPDQKKAASERLFGPLTSKPQGFGL